MKHITEFDLQDAKNVRGDERLEWQAKVSEAIMELENLEAVDEEHLNEIWGDNFVAQELDRLLVIQKVLDEDEPEDTFGINVVVKFSHVVDAVSYDEAVKIVKDSILDAHNIELTDDEIDPEEFDLRSVLDLLDANGFEEASNFLQLQFANEEDE